MKPRENARRQKRQRDTSERVKPAGVKIGCGRLELRSIPSSRARIGR